MRTHTCKAVNTAPIVLGLVKWGKLEVICGSVPHEMEEAEPIVEVGYDNISEGDMGARAGLCGYNDAVDSVQEGFANQWVNGSKGTGESYTCWYIH